MNTGLYGEKPERYIPQLYPAFQHWSKWDNIWIIGDVHTDDLDIQTYFAGKSTEEIITKLNKIIGKQDMIIFLGDLGAGFRQLGRIRAGHLVLVTGNHDAGCKKFQRKVFTKKFDADVYTKVEAMEEMRRLFPTDYRYYQITAEECWHIQHSPFHYWECKADNCLFSEIYNGVLTIGPKIVLSHEAIDCPWAMNLHEHHHSKDWTDDENHICLCGEKIDYEPLNLKRWIKNGGLSKIPHIHDLTIEKAKARHKEEV